MYFVPLLEQKYYKMTIQNISKYQIVFIFQIIFFCLPLSLTAQDEMNVNFNKIGDKQRVIRVAVFIIVLSLFIE